MNPICNENCATDLTEPVFSDCTPVVLYSEIRRIPVARKEAAPFVDVTSKSEWEERIALPADDVNRIFLLTVIGNKPAATPQSKEISNGRIVVIGKDHVLNYRIDDVSDENYEFMRQLECGGKLRTWYETNGAKMYGGNSGVIMTHIINDVLDEGADATEVLAGTATWKKKFHPERTVSPIYNGDDADDNEITFDTVQTFVADEEANSAGVTTTLPATNPNAKFEFNAIPGAAGGATNMTIKIGVTSAATVSFPAAYLGDVFKFTDINGVAHGGVFAAGNVQV